MLLHEFHKSSTEKVVVQLREFRGRRYLDLRIYFDASYGLGQDWRPSKKGLTVSVEDVDKLRTGVDRALSYIYCSGGAAVGQ